MKSRTYCRAHYEFERDEFEFVDVDFDPAHDRLIWRICFAIVYACCSFSVWLLFQDWLPWIIPTAAIVGISMALAFMWETRP